MDNGFVYFPFSNGNVRANSQLNSAQTWDVVDSGQSEDIENSLTGQGVSDRETTVEAARSESEHGGENAGGGGR